MRWGRKWGTGSLWGSVNNLRSTSQRTPPPSALLEWDPYVTSKDVYYQVYVNGQLVDVTKQTSLLVQLAEEGRFYFDVFAVIEADERLDLSAFTSEVPERIKLTWKPGATWGQFKWGLRKWGSTSAVSYAIYWDEGKGTSPLVFLARTGDTTYTTTRLADGTYIFRVDPEDAAGNKLTSSITTSIALSRAPDPPAALVVTDFDVGTETFTATWTESTSADVTEYRIYSNGGSGAVDYSSPVATVAAPASSASWAEVGAAAGDWIHAIRAYDGTFEEDNVHVRYEHELGGSPLAELGLQPATPANPLAVAIAGGKVSLLCSYPAAAEDAVGTVINWYGDAGTGTIDYGTIIATGTIPSHDLQAPLIAQVAAETGVLTDGTTYLFACKAADAGGRESDASSTVTATADSTAPQDVTELSAEAVI